MCGQRCGFDITATTAIPDAVLTGFARSWGSSTLRYSSGTAAMISTNLGARGSMYLLEAAILRLFRSTSFPSLTPLMRACTTSATARTRASSGGSCTLTFLPCPCMITLPWNVCSTMAYI